MNKEKSFPIVCHKVRFDRDSILKPAFKKAGNPKGLPTNTRWQCTMNLADELPDVYTGKVKKGLDDLYEYFGLVARGPDAKHDAYDDCIRTGELYMKLKETLKSSKDKEKETKDLPDKK